METYLSFGRVKPLVEDCVPHPLIIDDFQLDTPKKPLSYPKPFKCNTLPVMQHTNNGIRFCGENIRLSHTMPTMIIDLCLAYGVPVMGCDIANKDTFIAGIYESRIETPFKECEQISHRIWLYAQDLYDPESEAQQMHAQGIRDINKKYNNQLTRDFYISRLFGTMERKHHPINYRNWIHKCERLTIDCCAALGQNYEEFRVKEYDYENKFQIYKGKMILMTMEKFVGVCNAIRVCLTKKAAKHNIGLNVGFVPTPHASGFGGTRALNCCDHRSQARFMLGSLLEVVMYTNSAEDCGIIWESDELDAKFWTDDFTLEETARDKPYESSDDEDEDIDLAYGQAFENFLSFE